MKLCREAIVSFFTQRITQAGDQQTQSLKNVSSEANQVCVDAFVNQADMINLMKPKEIAALWDILKLSTTHCIDDSQTVTRNTLAGVLLGRFCSLHIIVKVQLLTYYVALYFAACMMRDESISELLTELGVSELEEVTSETGIFQFTRALGLGLGFPQAVVQESSHPYTDDVTLTGISSRDLMCLRS